MKQSLNKAIKGSYAPLNVINGSVELELRETINFLIEENKKLKSLNTKLEKEKDKPQKALQEAVDLMVAQNEELLEKKETLAKQNYELARSEEMLKDVIKKHSESEAKYKSIVDGFIGFVGLLSKDYHLNYTNDKYLSNLMIKNRHSHKCHELLFDNKTPCENCPMKSVLLTKKSVSQEIYNEKTDQWYQIVYSPVDNNDNNDYIVLLISNITERKTLEKKLEEEKDKLEKTVELRTQALNYSLKKLQATNINLQEVNTQKDKFLSSMSHELRTPLNAIIGFAKLLEDRYFGDLNKQQLEYMSYINSSSHHLLSLINDLLDIAKINAGKFSLQSDLFEPNSSIEKVIMLMKNQFLEKNISLETNLKANEVLLKADKRKFKQILLNLLSNALKFTDYCGSVSIETSIYENKWYKVVVKDTGIGIKKEFIDKIFTDFYQLEYTQKNIPGGTGIGLTISKHLVKLHNGKIGVESEYNKGSSFWFMLPLD
ncbi:MAG: sensor histidine kinase [Vampirovibrionia bacterium]